LSLKWEAQNSGFRASASKSGSDQAQPSPFDETYIGNPVGLYQLKATFQPDQAGPQLRLTSSVYIKVLDGPDSLELIKQKLSQKK